MQKTAFSVSNTVLDQCDDLNNWQVIATDGVKAYLSVVQDGERKALKFDYDFQGRAGFALIRKRVELSLPENYNLSFDVKANSPNNTLEVKFVDPSGDNVWWLPRPAFAFPTEWKRLVNKARKFTYAWGPDRSPLAKVDYIELVVTASTGGSGTVFFDNLTFSQLPVDNGKWKTPLVTLSSGQSVGGNLAADAEASWQSAEGGRQYVTLDYDTDIEFGGLVIDWQDDLYPTQFSIEVKADGEKSWKTVYQTDKNRARRSFVYLPECEARLIRLNLLKSRRRGSKYGIKRLALQPLSFSAQPADFWAHVAASSERGSYPRYLERTQTYWTVVGAYGDSKKALLSEDGMVEVEKLGFSIEPVIASNDNLLTWANGGHEQTLVNGWMPIPQVARKHDNLELGITAWAHGAPASSVLYVQYCLENTSKVVQEGTLYLCARPFQVNPPWQFLNAPGGFSPISVIEAGKNCLRVNDRKDIISLTPARSGVTTLEQGDIVEWARRDQMPRLRKVEQANGFASGALAYLFELEPGQERTVTIAIPFHDNGATIETVANIVSWETSLVETIGFWNEKFSRLNLNLPESAKDLEETIKAQLAYILVNRNGPRIQPGTRCYDRSWARDGALTSSALLQFGFTKEVKEFIDWFSPYQFDDGKVPCVVDDRGADPTPEHDSPGEFLFLITEYYRYTRDRKFLSAIFPRVMSAVRYVVNLSAQTRTAEFASDDKVHLRGLLPPSISHEGYSDKPAYSYWDDFWCLIGLNDALFLAEELLTGGACITKSFVRLRDQFAKDMEASVRATMKKHDISYIPGAADRGDFDPTSTTIALDPGALAANLEPELRQTFELYWNHFQSRKNGLSVWQSYTPYELRSVGAFLRLGHADRAHQALDWFMKHRRPVGWKHWGEVVHRDPLTPKFIGDMPHTWVGSDFLRSVANLFVYERGEGTLVVGAGFKREWLLQPDGTGITLPTRQGTITLEMRRNETGTIVKLSGNVDATVVLHLPINNYKVWVDDRPMPEEIPLGKLPREVKIELV